MITDITGAIKEKRQFDAWGNIVKLEDGAGNALTAFVILDRGYTGHEHLLGVGLINMNGRLYDPILHRFLSPDNFVQDPTNTQNFNRYGYVLNNPLKYTDASGEFAWLIPALIGGFSNWIAHGAKFSWEGLGYFGTGAIAGVLGAGAASGVTSIIGNGSGFIFGATVGASGGFAGGFTGGFGNALMGGSSFGSALGAGLGAGGIGALSGGLIGGVAGGINAANNNRDFWTGNGTNTYEETGALDGLDNSSKVEYSNESAKSFSDSHEELRRLSKNVDHLYADNSVPKDYEKNGSYFNKVGGTGHVYGITTHTGIFGQTTNVYLAPVSFSSPQQLYLVMHHEYMHAWFYSNGFQFTDKQEHSIIRGWERTQIQNWAPYNLYLDPQHLYFGYKFSDDYLKYGFKTIFKLP